MNVVSFTEDILDRLIEEVGQIRSKLSAPQAQGDKSQAHLKACEEACQQLLSKLQRAKEIAADPELGKALRIDTLQIENSRIQRDLGRANKELERLRSKFTEHRQEGEKALAIQAKRAADAEAENRSLRDQLRNKRKAIEHFAQTHRVARKKRRSGRKTPPQS